MLDLLFKTLEVIRHRFIFEDRIRISEFFDMVFDNLYKVLPEPLVEPVHHFLHELTDELIWL